MKLLDDFFNLEKQVHKYFGYVEDWKKIPLEDFRGYFWHLDEDKNGCGHVSYFESEEGLEKGEWWQDQIYTQRFLPKWVYRGKDYTMISMDPQQDMNYYLGIFDNSKEIKKLTKEQNKLMEL